MYASFGHSRITFVHDLVCTGVQDMVALDAAMKPVLGSLLRPPKGHLNQM